MKFNDGKVVTKRVDDFKLKAQFICKFFRDEVVQVSLKTMGKTFDVAPATISAWEHGKSSNFDFISYYYDMIQGEDYKKLFLRLIFDCDNKRMNVIVHKKLRPDVAKNFYSCEGLTIQELEKQNNEKGSITFQINKMM